MSKITLSPNGSGTGTFTIASPNSNTDRTLTLPDAGGEVVVADSSGNVGIGTTSPAYKLDTSSTSNVLARFSYSGGASGYIYGDANIVSYGSSASGSNSINFYDSLNLIRLYTNGSEAMRIDSSGRLFVGHTSDVENARMQVTSIDRHCLSVRASSIYHHLARFVYGATTVVGSITTNGSSTSYNTTSDYRLKTGAQPMTGASARVQALNPVNFEWIADGTRVDGFLAHEAQAVVPEAVTGTKDAVEVWRQEEIDAGDAPANTSAGDNKLDGDGNTIPDYQGIDQSKLVPLLTAALQEALTKIDDLETRLTALEAV